MCELAFRHGGPPRERRAVQVRLRRQAGVFHCLDHCPTVCKAGHPARGLPIHLLAVLWQPKRLPGPPSHLRLNTKRTFSVPRNAMASCRVTELP